ncbi:MAG: outer membrane protein assembly factor [Myxococcaceae bacterium]
MSIARLQLAALLALATATGCATTAAEDRPDGPVVEKLDIQGTNKISDGDIKKKILTTERTWWHFWEEPPRYEPNAWQADLHRIQRYYQAQGYYDAQVVDDDVKPVGDDKVDLSVKVTEGEPTRVGDIQVTGLDALPAQHKQTALEDFPLKKGDLFLEESWSGVKQQVRSRLNELGYAQADVKGDVFVDVGKHLATVHLDVDPGLRFKFGNIFVAQDPNPKVRAARIIEQAQGAIRKGDWYSESALGEAQSRVFQMGVFGAVKVNRGAPDPATATVPVVVDVREAPFHTVKAGGGVGLDQTRNEARLLAEYTDRNFFGGLRRFTVRGKAGIAFLPSVYTYVTNRDAAQVPAPFGEATAEFEQPRFLFRDLSAQAILQFERGVEPAYRYLGGRTKLGVIWQPHPAFSIFPSYNAEMYFFDEGTASLTGRSPALAYGCPNKPCVLSYLEETAQWDRRNDKQDPHRGYYLALSLQEGGGILQGSFNYFRIQPDARYYVSVGSEDQLTIATRFRVGTLIPAGNATSPIVARFFSGGPGMRGFGNRRLSPLQVTVTPTSSGDEIATVPVGGNGLVEGSLELRYSVTRDLVLAIFYDVGAVTPKSLSIDAGYFSRNLLHAVGIGFRYRTLVGPIRFDIARRLNIGQPLTVYQPADRVVAVPASSGCFGLGETHDATIAGAPESPCAFHISIGEAF